ncbi:unnamed protein product [Parajaminaea phylloscopi]
MQSNFNTILFFLLCASATFLQASADIHAQGARHHHGLTRRAHRRDVGDHIHVPLTRSSEWTERGLAADTLNRIGAQIAHLGKKYASNSAAFEKSHGGQHNPVLASTAAAPKLTLTNTTAGVPLNCTKSLTGADSITNDPVRSETESLDARAATSGTLPLAPTSNYNVWTGYMAIGKPSTNVLVSFDTGSADFVLNMNQGYTPSKSSTSKKTGNGFEVRYADGTYETGIIYNETVSVAGKAAYGQAIGVPTDSTFAASDPAIVGMAFQSVSVFQRRPLLQTLARYGSIPRAMFGVALSRTASKAEIRIGGYNPAKLKKGSSLAWSSIDASTGFWAPTAARIRLGYGGHTRSYVNRRTILDTGTTLILASTADVSAFFDKLNITSSMQGDYLVGVVPTSSPPTLAFTYGYSTYTVDGDAMLAGAASAGHSYVAVVGCDSLGLNKGDWLVGDSFFSKVYTVFDADRKRVGFAPGNF